MKKKKKMASSLKITLPILVLASLFAGYYHYSNWNPSTKTTYVATQVVDVVVRELDDLSELKIRTEKEQEELELAARKEEEALMRELTKLDNELIRIEQEELKVNNQKADVLARLDEIRNSSFTGEESSPERNSN